MTVEIDSNRQVQTHNKLQQRAGKRKRVSACNTPVKI